MAVFTYTPVVQKEIGMGYVIERGTWNDANGDAVGTITAAASVAGSPSMGAFEIKAWSFTNDNNNLVKPSVSGVAANQIKITCTASDTGTYTLICKAK